MPADESSSFLGAGLKKKKKIAFISEGLSVGEHWVETSQGLLSRSTVRRPQAFFSGVYTVPPFPSLEGEAFLQSPSNEVLLSQRLSTMFSSVPSEVKTVRGSRLMRLRAE